MSECISNYVISGGEAGKSRLNILATVLEPYTRELLSRMGVGTGSAFLDTGCGGGNVALMAAEMTGPGGQVTAIDFDEEIIRLAESDRDREGLQHLRFLVGSAYDLDFSGEFDTAYARFLLSHLEDPLAVLLRMKDAVRPGGKVVVEDVQFSGHFCHPQHEAFARYLELYAAVVDMRGGNAELGPLIPGLFRQAGLRDIGFDVIQPVFGSGEGKWMGWVTLARIRTAVVQAGLIDERELERLLRSLEIFTASPDTLISLPRIFRVWGTKEG